MLKLVKLEEKYRHHLTEMMDEWTKAEEGIVPYSIRRNDYRDFDSYLDRLEVSEEAAAASGLVPDSTFFCLDTDRDRFVGAVNIRHRLNEALLRDGGHIGDGIRPSERGKGFGTEMIRLALAECRSLGIQQVLMVCAKENTASARTIQKNGGILENEILSEGITQQRYWINVPDGPSGL